MIALLILLAFELFRNWYIIVKRKQRVNHLNGLAFRALVILIVAFFKFDLEPDNVVIFGRAFVIPVTTILYCIGSGLAFWFPFDLFLNLIRGKVWNHLGSAAVLDRFNIAGDLEWVVKFVLMLVGIKLLL